MPSRFATHPHIQAAPSANRSGRPSPTLASHVHADLDGLIPMIIDADAIASDANGDREGACDLGLESTVIDALSYDEPVM